VASLRHTRAALVFLAVGVGATLVYAVSGSRSLDALIVLGLTAGAAVALLWGAHTYRAARPTLYALAAAELAGLAKWVLWEHDLLPDGARSTTAAAAEALWLVSSLGLAAGCMLLLRSRERGSAPLLDSGIVACGLGIVAWIFVFEPAEASSSWAGTFDLAYAVVDIGMLALVARLVLRRLHATPAGALLVAGAVALFAGDLFYMCLLPTSGYAAGTWHDLGWLASPLLIGAAALHSSVSAFAQKRILREERVSKSYLLLLAGATLSVPSLAAIELLGGPGIRSPVVLGLTSAMGILVVVRVAVLIRQSDALRHTLSAQNSRLRDRTVALELMQRIANAANEAASSDEALARAIREICTATGWPVGHVYVKEPGFPQLAPRPLWYLDDPERWSEFVLLSDRLHFVAGHGLPGLVLERGEPVWLEAGAAPDPRYPRSALAHELGIRSLFAFPVLVGNEVAAVLEFFSTEDVDPEGRLVQLAGPIGVQLARVLERERAEAAMRASEERFRSLVDNVPGAIYRISSEDGRRTVHYLSDDILALTGYDAADFIEGRITAQDVIHPDDQAAVDLAMTRASELHSPFSLEYRMIHRDGGVRWVSESGRAVHDEATGSTWFDGSLVDVTARKQGEEALAHLAAIVESSQDAIVGTTLDGTIVSWNRGAERLYGYTAAEVVGTSMSATVPADRGPERADLLARAERAEVVENFETVRVRADGTLVDVSLTISPVRDAAGTVVGASAIARDITAAKEAERKLRAAEDRFRTLAEQLPLTTYIDAPDASTPSYVSPQIETMCGYPAAEWLGDSGLFAKLLHPDDRERVLAAIADSVEAGTPLSHEYRMVARGGSVVWLRDSAVTVPESEGGPAYRQGYAVDITAAKEAEELLRETEAKYRALAEQLPLATYVVTEDEKLLYISPQIASLAGYTAEEWMSDPDTFWNVLHPDDRDLVRAAHAVSFREQTPFAMEYRLIHRDGCTVWIQDEMVTRQDEDGAPLHWQGYLLDISERKEGEERLRDSEERTRLLFDTALDAIVTMDAAGTITGWNAQAEATFGWSADEAIGRRLSETVIPPEHRTAHERGLERFLSTGEARVLNKRIEVAALHRDGSEFPVELAITPLARGGAYEFSAFLRDISARRRAEAERDRLLEAERAQIERLRELDRLKDEFIALVSHELRTPLTSIRGYLELVTDGASGELTPDQEQFLGVVARNAERLQSLVGDLLFVAQIEAGRLALDRADLDLVAVAAESVESGRPLAAPKEIELSLAADPQVRLDGDRGRLGQLLDNFVSNAIKFTPAGGRVDVRVREEHGSAVIEVADTGMGIPADEQEQLFERFFRSSNATAQAIQGTGLGLTISKAIVDAHGGTISFTSIENQGTTFRIELPLSAALAEAA
jgi:PAS domain S-box-containing protein